MTKPGDLFDRDREWAALEAFVTADRPGALLGLVYGRRRQGKTFLLELLTEQHGGFYFSALSQSNAQNLTRLAEQYQAFTGSRAGVAFGTWEQAFEALLALGEKRDEPVVVVIDEFPYLLEGAPELPSVLQNLLRPRGPAARSWRSRLILCGSALSVMRNLLAGTAPLRGRAALELMVHPFGYRDAAEFWGLSHEPDLALRLHALVGGTPAYRDMTGTPAPTKPASLDTWVAQSLLNPASAMFREGNVLLSEEPHVVDTAVYHAVLSALSQGRTRRGELASTLGRAEGALSHPLAVLTEARLVEPLDDAFRQRRTTFHITEPVLRLHQLVLAPHESRLNRHRAQEVWNEVQDAITSKVYGPHFESICRTWCAEHAPRSTLGGTASKVLPALVACQEHRTNHELDAVVLETKAGVADRVVALGEAKWRAEIVGFTRLNLLEHIRSLVPGAEHARLLLFSRSGFTSELVSHAAGRADLRLVGLEQLYQSG